jgi:hypothetical protein
MNPKSCVARRNYAEMLQGQTIAEDIVATSSMRAGGAPRDDNTTLANEIDASANAISQAEDSTVEGNVASAAYSGRSGPCM